MPKLIHPIAGALALCCIALFWTATVISEVFMGETTVIAVKTPIPWGFLILIPAMAAAGASGFRLGGKWRGKLVSAKKRRMPIIAANGGLVLIPSALWLASKAQAGDFDTAFYVVQTVELMAGALNITLLALNMRDGLRMTAGRRARRGGQPSTATPPGL